MANILYAIQSEGMGHCIRSKALIEQLSKKHKIMIACSGKVYELLSKQFDDVINIHYMPIFYKNNRVATFTTFWKNVLLLPYKTVSNYKKLIKALYKFKPHLIISDFEPFSDQISNIFRLPVINIDNQHILTRTKLELQKGYTKEIIKLNALYRYIIPHANYYFITSFFYPKINKRNTFLFPPVLRKEILNAKTNIKKHIVVYQTSTTHDDLFKELKKVNKKFIVYGFNINKKQKNLVYKKFSEKNLIKDLASCEAVITNGGFTLISEAIYLRKPILSIPVREQFEQIINAFYIKKLGYGEFHKYASKKIIEDFLKNLDKYRSNLKNYKQDGNKKILKKLDAVIKRFESNKRLRQKISERRKKIFKYVVNKKSKAYEKIKNYRKKLSFN